MLSKTLRFEYNSSSEDTSLSESKFSEFSDEYPLSGIYVLNICPDSQAQFLRTLSTTFMFPIVRKSTMILDHFRSGCDNFNFPILSIVSVKW